MDPKRQLKIKSGSCHRLAKDVKSYTTEQKSYEAELQKLIVNGADPHDIKRQREFLSETEMTLQDILKRIPGSLKDLITVIEKHQNDVDVKDSEELEQARKIYAEVSALIQDESKDEKSGLGISVAVFGNDADSKDLASAIGKQLAELKCSLVNVNNNEALAQGARAVIGSSVSGFVSNVTPKTTGGVQALVHQLPATDALIFLSGSLSSLADLLLAIEIKAASAKVLAAKSWQPILQNIASGVPSAQDKLKQVQFFESVDELAALLSGKAQ